MINWTNMTSIDQLPAIANVSTGGLFWVGMIFMIFVVLLVYLLSWGFEVALITASTITLFIAVPFAFIELIDWVYVALFMGIDLALFLYISYSSNKKVS